MKPEELQACEGRHQEVKVGNGRIIVTEEGIVFSGGDVPLLADPVEELRVALDEIEQLRGALELRESVYLFATDMERKLQANDHKGGWDDCTLVWLYERMREEVRELHSALWNTRWDMMQSPQPVIDECADVANFAMMIADIARQGLAGDAE